VTSLSVSSIQESGEMEKAVIVSQWTSMLDIMKSHVEKIGMKCSAINGNQRSKLL
jgi:SNF2 family DNA or RNA helicase